MDSKLFLFALLLFACSIHSIESTSTNISTISNERPILKLMDLYDDVLHLIFCAGLNFTDLMNVAQINSKFHSSAATAYHSQYRDYEIEIRRAVSSYADHVVYVEDGKSIELVNETFAWDFIKYFGNKIEKLKIIDESPNDRLPLSMLKYANENMTETLTHLYIGSANADTLQHLTKPFERIKDLRYNINRNQTGPVASVDKIFPNAETLKIGFHSNLNYSFTDCDLPNLKHLILVCFSQELLERFLLKHPDIQTIHVYSLPAEFYAIIDHLMPELDKFGADAFHTRDQNVHLANTKHFEFINYPYSPLNQLSIPQLQSLYVVFAEGGYFATTTIFDIYCEFFARHQNLRKLDVKTKGKFLTERLIELVSRLPNVVELVIESTEYLHFNVITRIIESLPKLEKFSFKMEKQEDFDSEMLQELVGDEWNVNDFEGPGILLEKI